jgi:hypothetical protein
MGFAHKYPPRPTPGRPPRGGNKGVAGYPPARGHPVLYALHIRPTLKVPPWGGPLLGGYL